MSTLLDDVVVTAATEPLVDVYEFKTHARIDYDDDDVLIETLLKAAEQHVEAALGRAIQTQTRRAHYSGWETPLVIPTPQVASVTSVIYLDSDRAEQTVAAADYCTSNLALPWCQAEIIPASSWPASISDDDANPVRVLYVAGYGAIADVPEPIRQVVKLMAAHLYENREASSAQAPSAIPLGFRYLIEPYRFRRIFP